MDARTSKMQKRISAKQEKRMAEDLGGRVQPASGALKHAKGDVRVMGSVRAEAKYTSKSQYTLKLAELEKIIGEAGLDRAVLQVCFADRANRPILELAVFPWNKTEGVSGALERADIQTFAKSLRLDRDRIAVKLLSGDRYIVFSEKGGEVRHRWFRISNWKDYLTLMEEIDA
jgi:hypothetical protein